MTLQAFHNDPKIKKTYLARVVAHRKADELIKGKYWEKGKGCAVGCTIHSSEHNRYETELGIPEWLARIEDTIFEGLPDKEAKMWPERFLKAIKPGANLEKAKAPFLIFVLQSTLDKFDHAKYPDVLKCVNTSIALWQRDDIGSKEWNAAARAAYAAAADAADAAAVAAAAVAAARAAAARAAYADAAAARAARAAADAARAAAAAYAAAYAAAAARAAADAARAAYEKFADKLLEILESCE